MKSVHFYFLVMILSCLVIYVFSKQIAQLILISWESHRLLANIVIIIRNKLFQLLYIVINNFVKLILVIYIKLFGSPTRCIEFEGFDVWDYL